MLQENSKDEVYLLKKQLSNQNNQLKKERALYEQKLQFMEMKLKELESREENISLMNDTIMKVLNDFSSDRPQVKQSLWNNYQNKLTKELQNSIQKHSEELQTYKSNYQERIKQLEKEKQVLEDSLNQLEVSIKNIRQQHDKEISQFQKQIVDLNHQIIYKIPNIDAQQDLTLNTLREQVIRLEQQNTIIQTHQSETINANQEKENLLKYHISREQDLLKQINELKEKTQPNFQKLIENFERSLNLLQEKVNVEDAVPKKSPNQPEILQSNLQNGSPRNITQSFTQFFQFAPFKNSLNLTTQQESILKNAKDLSQSKEIQIFSSQLSQITGLLKGDRLPLAENNGRLKFQSWQSDESGANSNETSIVHRSVTRRLNLDLQNLPKIQDPLIIQLEAQKQQMDQEIEYLSFELERLRMQSGIMEEEKEVEIQNLKNHIKQLLAKLLKIEADKSLQNKIMTPQNKTMDTNQYSSARNKNIGYFQSNKRQF